MISERDKSVVITYVRTGMSLETLIRSFPQFDADEITKLYQEEREIDGAVTNTGLSINCS